MLRWPGCSGQSEGSAGGQCSTSLSLFRLLSFLLRLHYLQAGIMSHVIDPNSADSEVNCRTGASAPPVGTPSQLGSFPGGSMRGGCVEPGCLVSASSSQNSEALLAEVPHR